MLNQQQQQRPGDGVAGAHLLSGEDRTASVPAGSDDELCHWCGRHPRWRDPKRDQPWSACRACLMAFRDMDRRRHQAASRMPPLPDVTLPQQRSAASLDVGDLEVAR